MQQKSVEVIPKIYIETDTSLLIPNCYWYVREYEIIFGTKTLHATDTFRKSRYLSKLKSKTEISQTKNLVL